MTRTCILHIGVHKTGTTAVQKSLAVHRDGLMAAGIHVPGIPGVKNPGRDHHGLAMDLGAWPVDASRPAFRAADLFAVLEETVADTVVVSSETMSAVQTRPDAIRDLVDAIGRRGFRPVVVATVRPQESILNSSYLEAVKMFKFAGAFGNFVGDVGRDESYDFNRRLERWYSLPGIRFVAVPYNRAVIGEGIGHAVLEAGGIERERLDAAGFAKVGVENPSPGRESVAAFRLLLRAKPHLLQHPRASTLFYVVYRVNDMFGWNLERFVGPGPELVGRIRETLAESNRRFAERFMTESWDTAFAEDLARIWHSNELDVDAFAAAHQPAMDVVTRKLDDAVAGLRPLRPPRRGPGRPRRGPLGWLKRLWH